MYYALPLSQAALPYVPTHSEAEQKVAQEIAEERQYGTKEQRCPPGTERIPPDPKYNQPLWWKCLPFCAHERDHWGKCLQPALRLGTPEAMRRHLYNQSIAEAMVSALGPPKSYGETMRRIDQVQCAPNGMRLFNEKCATLEQLRAAGASKAVLDDVQLRQRCAADPNSVYDVQSKQCRPLSADEQRIANAAVSGQSNTTLYVALGVGALALLGAGAYVMTR